VLDESISPPADDIAQVSGSTRATLTLRRVARAVAVPALLLMLGGLLAYGIGHRQFLAFGWDGLPGPTTGSLAQLTGGGRSFAGEAAMSLGLLALALVPAITVGLILLDHLRDRRWKEAAVAASVVAIMALSAILGKK
jgi:hypothetical protein